MGDLALVWDNDTGQVDMVLDLVTDDDLVSDEGMRTAVLLSIFPSARAAADDELPAQDGDRRGYWATEFSEIEGDEIGSKRWLLARSKNLPSVPIRLKEYDEQALQWMIDDGVVTTVEVTITIEKNVHGDRIIEEVKLGREGLDDVTFRFDHVWAAESAIVSAVPRVPIKLTWTSIVNCTVAAVGNNMAKTGGAAAWDAGAASVEQIPGDGYVEFSVNGGGGANQVMCGLSVGDTDQNFTDIDFGWLRAGTDIQVYEGGSIKATLAVLFGTGDLAKVQRVGTEIAYWHFDASLGTWTKFYTSLTASTGNLLVDTSIFTANAAILNAMIFGSET